MRIYGIIIIIIFLLIVDGILLFHNRHLSRENHKINQTINQPIRTLNECLDLNCFQETFLKDNINEINLVYVIPSNTCLSSSKYALDFLGKSNSLKEFTKVIFVGSYFDSEYQEISNIEYISVKNKSDIFKNSFLLVKPSILVMDKYNAHLLYELTPGDGFTVEKMEAFWASAETFFNNVYGTGTLNSLLIKN